ncbi:hypothetical protein Q5425_35170 [Amycolatopsis sp. A133]|uniref:hypothetical protein n=1 Tax=Amycolatopsis sp. A133 TaxID=3064472 RepID=UPI0027EE33D6|nr:hypothetical protein [Amycolatopsis sp. A133]MDQ7809003.1 hypothetical protein [Amycolatopsis sp. A133]
MVGLAIPPLVAVPASASASADIAILDRTLYLSRNPPAGSSAGNSRSIYLNAGNYTWSAQMEGEQYFDGVNRGIYLAAGTYTWTVTVTKIGQNFGEYRIASSLRLAGSSDPANIGQDTTIRIAQDYYLSSILY